MAFKYNPLLGGLDYYQSTPVLPSVTVEFNTADPNTPGTVFTPETPLDTDTLYISEVNNSQWTSDGVAYQTYVAPTVVSTEFYLQNTTIDAGGNKTAMIYRNGGVGATSFNTKKGLTSTSASNHNKWWQVFDYNIYANYLGDSFKIQMNEYNTSSGVGKSVVFNVIIKRQDPSVYLTIDIESGATAFDLANFDVLYNTTTKRLSFFYKLTTTYTYTNWLVLNARATTTSEIIWYNALIGTTLSGQTNDAITSKVISLNKVNGVFTFPTTDGTANYFLKTNGSGTLSWGVAGLSYFSEAQNTASPNATVYANSLTAVSSTPNADFVIRPQGSGAILGRIPDGALSGGNKRGDYAVDFQRVGYLSGDKVASGAYSAILNGQGCKATGIYSNAFGYISYATGDYSLAFGNLSVASNTNAIAFNGGTASGSGSLSFGATANATNSIAFQSGTASGANSVAFQGGTASGGYSINTGYLGTASGDYSLAMGAKANTFTQSSRLSLGCFPSDTSGLGSGYQQRSEGVVAVQTTNATAKSLNSYPSSIAIVLQNNQAMRIKGSIIAKQASSTNVGAWDFDCVIVRGVNAASTIIAGSANVNLVVNTGTFGTPTLTADTTNGGLDIKVIGVLATTINWSSSVSSVEIIQA